MQLSTQWHTAWGKNIETSSMSFHICTYSTDKKCATNMSTTLLFRKTCRVTSVSPSICTSSATSLSYRRQMATRIALLECLSGKHAVASLLPHQSAICHLKSSTAETFLLRWKSTFDAFTFFVCGVVTTCWNLFRQVADVATTDENLAARRVLRFPRHAGFAWDWWQKRLSPEAFCGSHHEDQ